MEHISVVSDSGLKIACGFASPSGILGGGASQRTKVNTHRQKLVKEKKDRWTVRPQQALAEGLFPVDGGGAVMLQEMAPYP